VVHGLIQALNELLSTKCLPVLMGLQERVPVSSTTKRISVKLVRNVTQLCNVLICLTNAAPMRSCDMCGS
jgi:hypothetical protein